MGWQVDGACYATQLQAVQAAVSGEVGKVVTIGTVSYVVDVTATTSLHQRLDMGATATFWVVFIALLGVAWLLTHD